MTAPKYKHMLLTKKEANWLAHLHMRKLQWLNVILSLKKKEIKIPAILVLICVDHLGFYVAQVNHLEVDHFYVCYAVENLRRMLLVLL